MTFEEVNKYMSLGAPCDLEKRAYYLLYALRDESSVFSTFWDALGELHQEHIFQIITEELEDVSAIN